MKDDSGLNISQVSGNPAQCIHLTSLYAGHVFEITFQYHCNVVIICSLIQHDVLPNFLVVRKIVICSPRLCECSTAVPQRTLNVIIQKSNIKYLGTSKDKQFIAICDINYPFWNHKWKNKFNPIHQNPPPPTPKVFPPKRHIEKKLSDFDFTPLMVLLHILSITIPIRCCHSNLLFTVCRIIFDIEKTR